MNRNWIAALALLSLSACGDAKQQEAQSDVKFRNSNEVCIGPGYCVHHQNGQYIYGYYVSCVGTKQANGQCRVN